MLPLSCAVKASISLTRNIFIASGVDAAIFLDQSLEPTSVVGLTLSQPRAILTVILRKGDLQWPLTFFASIVRMSPV